MRSGRAQEKLRRRLASLIINWLLVISALCGVAGGPVAAAQLKPIVFTSNAPKGFDALSKPQTTVVDVYFGGVRITSTLARFTPTALQFLQPKDLASSIPHLKDAATIHRALAAEFPTNADKVCADGAAPSCGHLSPLVAGLIFDEARFRAELFINPAFLANAHDVNARYLERSTGAFSAVSFTGGVISGSVNGSPDFSLQNKIILSYKELHVISNIFSSPLTGFRLDSLAAVWDHGPLRYEGGIMQTHALDFFGQGRVAGISIGTQLDTLANKDLISATPIIVYLDQRSQVEIYSHGRLLSAQSYDAGNQPLDTSTLPDGAYEVTIRIHTSSGDVREEHRFFSRSGNLPPLGKPQFHLTVGTLLNDQDAAAIQAAKFKQSLYLQAVYARRMSQTFALDAGVSLVDSKINAATGFWLVSDGYHLHGEAVVSQQGDYGVIAEGALSLSDRAAVSLAVRQAWGRDRPPDKAAADQTLLNQAFLNPTVMKYGFTGTGTQITASASSIYRGAQWALSASYAAARYSPTLYSIGGSVDAPLAFTRIENLHGYISAAQTNRGAQVFLGLRFRFSQGRNATLGEVGYAMADKQGGAGPVADVAQTLDADTRFGEVAATGSYRHTAASDTLAANAQVRSAYGDAGVDLEQGLRGSSAATRYSANFLVGAALVGAHPSLGSGQGGESGVVVNVAGDMKGVVFHVLVNDAPVGRVSAGKRFTLFLPAYRTYAIRLVPMGGAAVEFDTTERTVSLYPGNMASLTWTAEPDIEVFGQALDAHGRPVANAMVSGARNPVFTDSHGYYQASLAVDRKLTLSSADGGKCRIELTQIKVVNGYAAVGASTCRTLDETLLVAQAPQTPAKAQEDLVLRP